MSPMHLLFFPLHSLYTAGRQRSQNLHFNHELFSLLLERSCGRGGLESCTALFNLHALAENAKTNLTTTNIQSNVLVEFDTDQVANDYLQKILAAVIGTGLQ